METTFPSPSLPPLCLSSLKSTEAQCIPCSRLPVWSVEKKAKNPRMKRLTGLWLPPWVPQHLLLLGGCEHTC